MLALLDVLCCLIDVVVFFDGLCKLVVGGLGDSPIAPQRRRRGRGGVHTPPPPGPGLRLTREQMRERVRRLYQFQSYEAWKQKLSGESDAPCGRPGG